MFKGDKCELTSSLSIIKPGKYRKLKDEVDDFDDVVQQGVSKVCSFNKHVHTIVLPFGAIITQFFSYYNVSASVLFRYAGTHALTFYVEVIRVEQA